MEYEWYTNGIQRGIIRPMRYTNVRQLSHNLKEEVKNLPVTVTQFGKPIFVITPVHAFEEPKKEVKEEVKPEAKHLSYL